MYFLKIIFLDFNHFCTGVLDVTTFADCSMHNTVKVLGTKYVDYLSSFVSNGQTENELKMRISKNVPNC